MTLEDMSIFFFYSFNIFLYRYGGGIKLILGASLLLLELILILKVTKKRPSGWGLVRLGLAVALLLFGLVWKEQMYNLALNFDELLWDLFDLLHLPVSIYLMSDSLFHWFILLIYSLALVFIRWQLRLLKRLKGLPQARVQPPKKSGQKAKATKPSPKPLAQAKSNQEKASRSKLPEPELEQALASPSAPLQNRSQEQPPSVHQPATQSGSIPTVLPQASNQDDRQQVIDGAQPREFEPVLVDLLGLVGDSSAEVYYRSHVDSLRTYLPKIQSNVDRLSRQGDQERLMALETELGMALKALKQLVTDLQADASVERIDQLNEIRYQLQRLT